MASGCDSDCVSAEATLRVVHSLHSIGIAGAITRKENIEKSKIEGTRENG